MTAIIQNKYIRTNNNFINIYIPVFEHEYLLEDFLSYMIKKSAIVDQIHKI